eukprot:352149-Chlamydomonas_euryale.AAC.5
MATTLASMPHRNQCCVTNGVKYHSQYVSKAVPDGPRLPLAEDAGEPADHHITMWHPAISMAEATGHGCEVAARPGKYACIKPVACVHSCVAALARARRW